MTEFERDERTEGAAAVFRNQPFSEHNSAPWQAGYTDAKHRQARKVLGPVRYHLVTLLLEALMGICAVLRHEGGEVGADLAHAVVHRTLAGEDLAAEMAAFRMPCSPRELV